MLVFLATAFLVLVSGQTPAPPDRQEAKQLARAGETVEALAAFERLVERDPDDVDARLWAARLYLRLGRTDEAEAGFRAVIGREPANVDAHIGLGATLMRRGDWAEALHVLR